MNSDVDERLIDEAARFRLAYGCERCAQFDEAMEACSAGYPNAEHREGDLASRRHLVFCKEFELA